MPYSLLVWENVSNLPLPEEISHVIKDVKWDEFEWHAAGLPIPLAKYTMTGGKELYLSELPNETIKVEKMSEFTGNLLMAGFFVDSEDKEGYNYFVNFLVTVLYGEVVEVKLAKVNKQPVKEYLTAVEDFQKNLKRVMKISNSWWYKWLYRPWFFVVRGLGFIVLFILKFINDITIYVVVKLTPM